MPDWLLNFESRLFLALVLGDGLFWGVWAIGLNINCDIMADINNDIDSDIV
jgi:hypothetical protein